MKFFMFVLTMAFASSSWAYTVTCDLYSRSNGDPNYYKVDSVKLGHISDGQFLQSTSRKINGLDGKHISVALGGNENSVSASVDISEGDSTLQGKQILSVQGSLGQGLSAGSPEKGFSFLCSTQK